MVYTPAASEASAGVYWMAWKRMDVHQQRVRFVVAAFRREKPLGLYARSSASPGRRDTAGWNAIAPAGWKAWSTQQADAVCPFIRLEGHTWDSYLATVGSSHRANVRRRIRNVESHAVAAY